MAEFTMEIAGCAFAVRSLFASTRDYCGRYLTDRAPEAAITVVPEDLVFEQRELDEEAAREGFRRRRFTDPFLDRAAIQRQVAEALLDRDTLMLHGSAIAVDGRGYLFMARSGTGKSTHTRLWREEFRERAVMVNDDKPFLRLAEDTVYLCGAPWSGKHGLDTNITVPLAGICLLERGEENHITPLEPGRAAALLAWQSEPPRQPERLAAYRGLLDRLTEAVPFWHLRCNRDIDAARTAHRAMARQEQTEDAENPLPHTI